MTHPEPRGQCERQDMVMAPCYTGLLTAKGLGV